jgi:hypothetical protein
MLCTNAPTATCRATTTFWAPAVGTIAPGRRQSVRTCTVEDTLRAVGRVNTRMGAADPRLNRHGNLDLRLTSLFQAWRRQDEPPTPAKPIPLVAVAQVWAMAHGEGSQGGCCCHDEPRFVVFFLLRPGEYFSDRGPSSAPATFASGSVLGPLKTPRAPTRNYWRPHLQPSRSPKKKTTSGIHRP